MATDPKFMRHYKGGIYEYKLNFTVTDDMKSGGTGVLYRHRWPHIGNQAYYGRPEAMFNDQVPGLNSIYEVAKYVPRFRLMTPEEVMVTTGKTIEELTQRYIVAPTANGLSYQVHDQAAGCDVFTMPVGEQTARAICKLLNAEADHG